jgi:alpha-glucosidase (family GH31 glycosyl hydrolase)
MLGRGIMVAPIVEKDTITRSVYFPSETWFNYHTGEEHKPDTTANVTCNLTDLVPMYLRSGIIVARNDAREVTRLKQLNNSIELVIALNLVERSVARYYYKAQGGLLALDDYDNNEDVTACIADGCDYAITASYSYDATTQDKILQVNIKYVGTSKVRHEQSVSDIYLYI